MKHHAGQRGPVLVTGASGLVGRATVARLREAGRHVIATDLRDGDDVVGADLTRADEVAELLARVEPAVVIHLAAVIPPLCYARPDVARAVNVGATEHLVAAASTLPVPPRFVLASSVAVYGARNPHRHSGLLTADLEPAPTDLYGTQKLAAEHVVRASTLDWVVLRLGGVMTVEQERSIDVAAIHFGSLLPLDGRIQTVDVRDVARAFDAATTADVVGETLLIGGDETHRLLQRDIGSGLTGAAGLEGGIPLGVPGDPADDTTWFATDWMDTTRAQAALGFQQHTWPDMLAEVRRSTGRRRYLMRLVAPVMHEVLRRTFARLGTDLPYAGVPRA